MACNKIVSRYRVKILTEESRNPERPALGRKVAKVGKHRGTASCKMSNQAHPHKRMYTSVLSCSNIKALFLFCPETNNSVT